MSLVNDRFLVQLAKLAEDPQKQLSNEEIQKLWEGQNKSKLVQYKLKVDLGQDVQELIKMGGSQVPTQLNPTQSLYQSVQTGVMDMALKDDRYKKEESKQIQEGGAAVTPNKVEGQGTQDVQKRIHELQN